MGFHNPYVPMYSMYHLAQETLKTKEAELSGEQTRSQSLKVPRCLDPVHRGIFHGLAMKVDRHLMAFNRIFWRFHTGFHDDFMGLCGLFFWDLLVI